MTQIYTLITAPDVEPVTLAELKTHLRITDTDTDRDAMLTALLLSARVHIDGKSGYLGRAINTQTWELRLDSFPDEIVIPLPPLQSVTSVKYIDTDGVEQTLSTDIYQVTTDDPATIVEKYGQSWPSTRDEKEAVRVRFVAGYGDSADDVPEPFKTAIKFHVEALYDKDERKRELLLDARDEQLFLYRVYA
jgi:uncharacterized phiE125 gp8 family phage protein